MANKRAWYNIARVTTDTGVPKRTGRKRKVTAFDPGVASTRGGMKDVTVKYNHVGGSGPGIKNGWKQTGLIAAPAGSTIKRLNRKKRGGTPGRSATGGTWTLQKANVARAAKTGRFKKRSS